MNQEQARKLLDRVTHLEGKAADLERELRKLKQRVDSLETKMP